MVKTEDLRPDEQDFYDTVMFGSETMLPNKDASVTLHGVETTRKSALQLRRMGLASLDLTAPMTIGMRYQPQEQVFMVSQLGLKIDGQNRPLRLRRFNDQFKARPGVRNSQLIQTGSSTLDAFSIDLALAELDIPRFPPQEDPEEYLKWLNQLRARGEAWSTQEQSEIRKGRMGSIAASLIAIRQAELFPDRDFVSIKGVEYKITDRTHPDSVTTHTSFVGEHADSRQSEFSSYIETAVRYRKGQGQKRPRESIALTPLNRKVWLEKIIDDTTDVPYMP